MAQRLLLEGSDIDELLLRVRTEHGPDARIVHAERKLVGGWGGFFAKRRYEVAVAVDEAAELPAPAAAELPVLPDAAELPARPELSRDFSPALSSAMSSTMSSSQSATMSSVASPTSAFAFRQATALDAEPPAPSAIDDLLADADARDGGVRTAGRLLSTESDAFDELVRDLVARAVPESRTSAVPDFAPATPRIVHQPEPQPVAVPEPAVVSEAKVVPEATAGAEPAVAHDDVQPEVAATPSPARTLGPRALAGGAPRARLVTPAVARLGLPVEPVPVDDDRLSLLEVLDGVAVKAPRRLVGVQLLVGDGSAVRALAAAWARTTGADPSCIVDLESSPATQGDDPRGRQEQLQSIAREHGGALVVLPAGGSDSEAPQVAGQLAGLGPCTVTATVDARWTASRTRTWLAALAEAGCTADRLAAYEIHETPDPLGLLEHGLPVTWLDCRPATIGAWASPCLDRWQ